MTKIQQETVLMRIRAEELAALPSEMPVEKGANKIAKNLAQVTIPAFERVREQAELELATPGGLSDETSDNYHNALSGIESQWGEGFSELNEDDNGLSPDWFNGILQAAKIHTLSRIASSIEPSGYPDPPAVPEGHGSKTKWPPDNHC